ncbi:type IV pilus modification protein PilV [Steroidobacter sp. S1-65]|uniref:Type IV pilus modification protein PilV n=1 Tax=Steroidobacter gossypii TaxID=2805490 RepID=A0ABS1WW24_9GAMM|nr:type IV pilus modification protein PilV [Steroidobacter gossypii]MBM0105163.1 type IV pilus modification protein PilV [Steroidobacter gossypii]
MKTHRSLGHRSLAGFSMVEVMVALVVLAVGMLGIAGVYVTTLRSSGSAISRLQAVTLAGDMADRIRANRWARGTYTNATGEEQECISAGNCTRDQMALHDVFLWKQQIEDLLPGDPQGTVQFVQGVPGPPKTPDSYTITVSWKEPGSGDGDAEDDNRLSYVLTMQVEP